MGNKYILRQIFLLSIVLFIYILTSCNAVKIDPDATSDTPTSNYGVTANYNATGNLNGFVELYSIAGLPLLDNSGVTVSISDPVEISIKGNDVTPNTVYTNKDGLFTFPDISAGLYTISFKKTGYGEVYFYNYPFPGNGDVIMEECIGMSAVPDNGILTLNSPVLSGSNNENLQFSGTLEYVESYKRYWVRFYFNDVSLVSANSTEYIYTDTGYENKADLTGLNGFTIILEDVADILPEGVTLSVSAYTSSNPWPNDNNVDPGKYSAGHTSVYRDYKTGDLIYTSLGTSSNVVMFKLN